MSNALWLMYSLVVDLQFLRISALVALILTVLLLLHNSSPRETPHGIGDVVFLSATDITRDEICAPRGISNAEEGVERKRTGGWVKRFSLAGGRLGKPCTRG